MERSSQAAEQTPDPATGPVACVQSFLDAMAVRDLARAGSMIGTGFVMHFPGAAPMNALQDLVEWARDRYQSVGKTISQYDHVPSQGGAEVVYCYGTLHGVWPDGTAFADVRFVDRFELKGGLITRQDVWNDLAEVRGAR